MQGGGVGLSPTPGNLRCLIHVEGVLGVVEGGFCEGGGGRKRAGVESPGLEVGRGGSKKFLTLRPGTGVFEGGGLLTSRRYKILQIGFSFCPR